MVNVGNKGFSKPNSAHADLQEDVCRYLEQASPPWITFKEMDLGLRGENANVQRADVLALKWTEPVAHIYEVKVSRADFLSDKNSGKWEGYLFNCQLFFFATPHGLITKEDVPEGAGWVEQTERGNNFRRRLTGAENGNYHIGEDQWFALVKKQAVYGG